jgi:hypothetical protein
MNPMPDPARDNIEVMPVVVLSRIFPARPSSIPEIRDFVNRSLTHSPLTEEESRSVRETVAEALLEAAGPTGAIQVSFRIFPDHVEVDVLKSHPTLAGPNGPESVSAFLGATSEPWPGGAGQGGTGPVGVGVGVGGPGPGGAAPGGPGGNGPGGGPAGYGPGSGSGGWPSGSGGNGPGGGPAGSGPGGGSGGWPSEPGGNNGLGDAEQVGAGGVGPATSFADWMAGALRRQGMTLESAARQLGVSVKTVSRWVGGATEPRLRDLRRIQELFGELPFP